MTIDDIRAFPWLTDDPVCAPGPLTQQKIAGGRPEGTARNTTLNNLFTRGPLRSLLHGHAGGNPRHSQGAAYELPRQFPTLPAVSLSDRCLPPALTWAYTSRLSTRLTGEMLRQYVDGPVMRLEYNLAPPCQSNHNAGENCHGKNRARRPRAEDKAPDLVVHLTDAALHPLRSLKVDVAGNVDLREDALKDVTYVAIAPGGEKAETLSRDSVVLLRARQVAEMLKSGGIELAQGRWNGCSRSGAA